MAAPAVGSEEGATSGTEARRANAGKAETNGVVNRRAEPTERVTEVRMLSRVGWGGENECGDLARERERSSEGGFGGLLSKGLRLEIDSVGGWEERGETKGLK